MASGNLPYHVLFGSKKNDGLMLLDVVQQNLARFIYKEAIKETDVPAKSDTTSNKDATMEKIQVVIDGFMSAGKKRENYFESFEKCGPRIKELIKLLEELAVAVETDKKYIKITQIISAIIGALAGIAVCLACPPAIAQFAPTALAVSGVVVAGACVVEHYRMKSKMKEANYLIDQIEKEFKTMAEFLEMPEKLKTSFESLIDTKILSEINKDVKEFFNRVYKQAEVTVGQFKEQFKEELQVWMKKMSMDSKISGLDDEMRPIVKTFLVVSLIKSSNQFVLDSVRVTLNSMFGACGVLNVGQVVGDFLVGAEGAGEAFGANVLKLFAPVTAIFNMIVVLQSAKQLSETSKLAQEIKERIQQLETSYLFLDNLYNQLKEIKFIHESDIIEWDTVLVLSVPLDAQQVDIKRAVKPYLLKEAHACIKLEKLQMRGNNWNVKVPKTHSEQLLLQSEILINEKSCPVQI